MTQALFAALTAAQPTSNLYLVDPTTAAMTSLGPIGFAVSGMAQDPTSGILYGSVSERSGAGNHGLITIDTGTGAGTLVGSFLGAHDIAFDASGQLWGIDTSGELMQIDKTTANYSTIGSGNDYGGGIDFDAFGTLFQVGDRFDNVSTIDLGTGAKTVVVGTSPSSWLHSGTIDSFGVFWASSPGGSGSGSTNLVTVDLVTGAITNIGTFTFPSVGALAWGSPPALTANFTAAPTGGLAPLTVTFTDHSLPGPSGPITGWAWDFGDSGTSSLQNPTHTYTTPGNYTVTLIVTGTSPDGTSTRVRTNYIRILDPALIKLYAALAGGDHTTSDLYLVNPSNASMTSVGPIGYAVTGLAYDTTTGTLYGTTSARSASHPRSLITIDLSTGAGTLVAAITSGRVVHDITFDAVGQLWGSNGSGGGLMKIDKTNGNDTFIGGGGSYAGGLDFVSGTLWKVAYNGSHIARLNLSTGAPTLGPNPSDGSVAHSGGFDPNGLFWASSPRVNSHAANNLVTIDVTTGTVTTIGAFTHAGVGAVAWVNTTPPPPDFLFTLVPNAITVSPGVSTVIAVDTTPVSGDAERITLSVTPVFGYTVTFDDNPITAGDDTTSHIAVSGSLSAPATVTIHFHAVGTDNSHDADLTIHLVPTGHAPGTHIAS